MNETNWGCAGNGLWLVLCPDPAVVADLVEHIENVLVVDLASARLVTVRIVGYLRVQAGLDVLRDCSFCNKLITPIIYISIGSLF